MTDVNRSRRYVSPLRDQSARQTRQAVLAAAREMFIAQGYVATTMEQIAERAGVSKPTVFASAGSKRAILKNLHDHALAGDDEPVPVASRPWYQEALADPDPRRSLRLHARNVVRMQQRYADLNEVLQMAAAADDELRQLWQITEDQRRTGPASSSTPSCARARSSPASTGKPPSTSFGPSPHPTSSGASPTTGNGQPGVSSNGSATPSANSSCPVPRHTHSNPGVRYPA